VVAVSLVPPGVVDLIAAAQREIDAASASADINTNASNSSHSCNYNYTNNSNIYVFMIFHTSSLHSTVNCALVYTTPPRATLVMLWGPL